jgi:hypothetical protein
MNLNADIVLNKEDVVNRLFYFDFVEEYKVTIDGEIKKGFDYFGLTLNDLLIGGGLTGSASKRVEIARMIIAEKFDDNDLQKAEVFNIEITPENNEQSKNFELKPFDVRARIAV